MTCDLVNDTGDVHPVTLVIAGRLELRCGDPDMVDAVSAIQLAGRLMGRWSLAATVGG